MISIIEKKEHKPSERRLPEPDRYAVCCPDDGSILQFYNGQFETVFVAFHPFIKPTSIDQALFYPATYPNKQEILASCIPIPWSEVIAKTSLRDVGEVDIGLRTGILGLRDEFKNDVFAEQISFVEDKFGLVRPSEGDIPALLENEIFECIQSLGYEWAWLGDEFGTERKLHWINDLKQKTEIPYHGNIFTEDHSLLVTTHWDSHFSFICSSRSKIDAILAYRPFEGFYCKSDTEVYWSLHH